MVLRIEGRREALGICERAQAMLTTRQDLERLLEQLQIAASGRPESYAAGVLEVADLVEKLLACAPTEAWEDFIEAAPRNEGRGNVARNETQEAPHDRRTNP